MEKYNYNRVRKPEPKLIPLPCDESVADLFNDYAPPSFNEQFILKLPKIFLEGIKRYTDNNQTDVFISSLLVILSSIVKNVYVIHNKERHGLNLYLFICANAGSGKSVMTHPLKLVHLIELYLKEQHQIKLATYEEEKKVAEENGTTPPEKPKLEDLFIPANSSHASFLDDLLTNNGRGIIYETEADTLTSTLKQDWGGYSEILRQAFHHESVKSKRKGKEPIIISKPFISLCVSGTPNQFMKLIPNAENGLLSRILIYNFKGKAEWDDQVFDSNGWKDYEEKSSVLGAELLNLYKYLDGKESIIYTWHKDHQIKLNEFFSKKLLDYDKTFGSDSNAIIKRLGLIASRIAATLRTVAIFEEFGSVPNEIESSDVDLEIVIHFISVFMEHSFNIYENLPKATAGIQPVVKGNIMRFFEVLPERFTRSEAVEIGYSNGFKMRTIDDYLQKLKIVGLLFKTFANEYEKSPPVKQ